MLQDKIGKSELLEILSKKVSDEDFKTYTKALEVLQKQIQHLIVLFLQTSTFDDEYDKQHQKPKQIKKHLADQISIIQKWVNEFDIKGGKSANKIHSDYLK